jgi:4-hydroxy-tetrahydrodipicolinate reductase
MKQVRAIVYGVGLQNRIATRLMVEKGVQVVGAVNRFGPKVGKDLGKLAGLEQPLGVTISDDPEVVLSTPADIVHVAVCDDMERGFPIYKQCLEHGINVLTVGSFASYPWRISPDLTLQLDELAKAHGVTITGTGNQDFFMVNLGTMMSGICHRLDRITHRSLSDVNKSGPEVAKLVHVGDNADKFDVSIANRRPSIYTAFWENVVADLGMKVHEIKQTTMPIVADTEYYCINLERKLESGKIIGIMQRLNISTKEGLQILGENTLRLCKEGEEEFKEWLIEGEPDLEIRARRLDTAFTTASQSVNRIPDVINASPGYVTLEQLPKLTFRQKPLSAYVRKT